MEIPWRRTNLKINDNSMGIRPIKFEMEIPWEGVNFRFQGSTDMRKGQAFSQKGVQASWNAPNSGEGGGEGNYFQ
jgi:hypothetical protein